MPTITLRLGDSFEIIATLEGVGAVVCDPPYLISFMGKTWDSEGEGGENAEWHRKWLEACFGVLPSGGIIKVFSATRTFHRLAAAMEEVGFFLDPEQSLEAWAYGSGFPKYLNTSKAVDKHFGCDSAVEAEIQAHLREQREALGLSKASVDRQVFGGTTRYSWVEGRGGQRASEAYLPTPEEWSKLKSVLQLDNRFDDYIQQAIPSREHRHSSDGGKAKTVAKVGGDFGYQQDGVRWDNAYRVTEAASEEAARFDGWATALKPGWEPFIVGTKP